MTVALNVSTNSAIYDYSTLRDEWENRLDRDDLTALFPQFVQMAEAFMRKHLRVLDQETTTSLTASAELVALPTDCLSIRSVHIEGSPSPDYALRGMSPAALAHEFNGISAAVPVAYAQINGFLKLAPPPSSSVTLSVIYIARFNPLTETITTNWILDDHPDVYFYGVLAQACDHIRDDAGFARYWAAFTSAVSDLRRARTNDRWGSAPLVPNTVRQVRGARC